MKKISNFEPKGTKDWFPDEFAARQYIFEKWQKVCLAFGFSQYLSPMVESAEIYRAKSGEDVGGKELVSFQDLGGRELCIRPEMTPSVVRMVSKIYQGVAKPLKYFSIANFMRNEKPQRGRNREFWQLNVDVFGSNNLNNDIEVMQLALELVLVFGATKKSFTMHLNSRVLINDLLSLIKIKDSQIQSVVRLMDKFAKLRRDDFKNAVQELGLKSVQVQSLIDFLECNNIDDLEQRFFELKNSEGLKELKFVINALQDLGYGELLTFSPSVIRGFDYYDGVVFEVFDNHPDNNRAMFGGGRYNGLGKIYGIDDLPAVGFAPGDETFKLFLESWGLLDIADTDSDTAYFPLLKEKMFIDQMSLAKLLRSKGKKVCLGYEEQKIVKALQVADKKGYAEMIIFGEDEKASGIYKIKNLKSGKEEEKRLN